MTKIQKPREMAKSGRSVGAKPLAGRGLLSKG